MPAELLDGLAVARAIRDEVAVAVRAEQARGVHPGLAVVLVGDDPASAVYVRNKGKACEEAGIHSVTIRLPDATTQAQLLAVVDQLNADTAIHGMLVQMPLPQQCNADEVIRRIDPAKDVDGFHPINAGKLICCAGIRCQLPGPRS
jgi:methylenetetrahydrofolate dehydrogenase (NADP+) / methenyltetrahydrofolate cyclohydrolase